MYNNEQELYHFGVKGMRWGHRKVRGHAGPGKYATRKRQLEGDKRDLQTLNNGGHLSVGLTKKRQAAYDKRDKAVLEKRIAKNEAKISKNEQKNNKGLSTKQKKVLKVGAAAAGTMLAVYGTYKFSKWVDNQNVKLATHTGQEFASKFTEQIRPKSPQFPGPAGMNRYSIGQSSAFDAGNGLSKLVTEKVYSPKRTVRIKNAFEASKVNKGKKSASDIFDYNKTVSEILKDEQVLGKGQSEFSKSVRTSLDMGGSIPDEILKYTKKSRR